MQSSEGLPKHCVHCWRRRYCEGERLDCNSSCRILTLSHRYGTYGQQEMTLRNASSRSRPIRTMSLIWIPPQRYWCLVVATRRSTCGTCEHSAVLPQYRCQRPSSVCICSLRSWDWDSRMEPFSFFGTRLLFKHSQGTSTQ